MSILWRQHNGHCWNCNTWNKLDQSVGTEVIKIPPVGNAHNTSHKQRK
eukprot:Gb_33692 [translate_table: standard]